MAANPHPNPDDEFLPFNQFLAIKINNQRLDPKHFRCDYPIIVEILKNHPIFTALNETTSIPHIYLQQYWKTLQYVVVSSRQHEFHGRLANSNVVLDLQLLRNILGLPQRDHYLDKQRYDSFPSKAELCTDILRLGYSGPLTHPRQFRRHNLHPLWRTLFAIVNRCLTSKHTGFDKCNLQVLQIFHGIVFHRHYDYALLIWRDLNEVVKAKGTSKARKFVPFQRFLHLIIKHFLRISPDIPESPNYPIIHTASMHFLQKETPLPRIHPMPIPEVLLAFVNQNAPSVREHRVRLGLAPIDQRESASPSQGAYQLSEDVERGEVESDIEGDEGKEAIETESDAEGDESEKAGMAESERSDNEGHDDVSDSGESASSSSSSGSKSVRTQSDNDDGENENDNDNGDDGDFGNNGSGDDDFDDGGDDRNPTHCLIRTPCISKHKIDLVPLPPTSMEPATPIEHLAAILQPETTMPPAPIKQLAPSGDFEFQHFNHGLVDNDILSSGARVAVSTFEGVNIFERSYMSAFTSYGVSMSVPATLSRVSTSGTRPHVLSCVEQVAMDPMVQTQTLPSHSTVSSQLVVSLHEALPHTLSAPYLENGGIESKGSSLPSPHSAVGVISFHSVPRTQCESTAHLSDTVETSVVVPSTIVSQGLEGNPTSVIIMPTLNVGHSVDSTVVSMGDLSGPRVTLPEFVSKDYLDNALKVVTESFTTQIAQLITTVSSLADTINSNHEETQNSLHNLTHRVNVLEETYKAQAQFWKRKHDDQDDPDHHEWEKRARLKRSEGSSNFGVTQSGETEKIESLRSGETK